MGKVKARYRVEKVKYAGLEHSISEHHEWVDCLCNGPSETVDLEVADMLELEMFVEFAEKGNVSSFSISSPKRNSGLWSIEMGSAGAFDSFRFISLECLMTRIDSRKWRKKRELLE